MKMYEMYVKQIQKYTLLDAETEKKFASLIAGGDKNAVQKLVKANLRLVVSIASKFRKSYKVSVMDLIQEGNLGLMAAAEKFSSSYNTRFSTYAYPWILQYMLRFIHNKTSIISIPQRKEEVLRRLSNVKTEFSQETGKEASVQELSRLCGITAQEVTEALDCLYTCTSLDTKCSDEGCATVGELIPDYTYDPERKFFMEIDKSNIKNLVSCLSEKERYVISCRYNLEGQIHAPTLREMGVSLGVSAETVRQTEIKALKKIRQAVDEKKIELYTA
ncbi:MAG: sigma-70 family RNA polymerase sigma factor [Treponema sp.]|nr:sigma-70 family RNA polymerase sigma factor [Treponema sp.]